MFQRHGQCAVWLKLLVPATLSCCSGNSLPDGAASPLAQKHCAGRGRGGWGGLGGRSGPRVGGLLWFALLASLHCLPACFAALCLLSVVSALAGFIHLLVKGTLFWFVCCASRGHRFALGTGGLKQSLLVGGIGPVYSLPKLCFKPFRSLCACSYCSMAGF